jgi:hypothetical protein
VLKHELAHSFINQASNGRCPQWLNEGIAQYVEGRQLVSRGARLAELYRNGAQLPLNTLEKSFLGFSRDEAVLAYDESLAATAFIRDKYDNTALRRILEHLGQGGSVDDALLDVLHLEYPQFEEDFSRYLVEKYGSQ